MKILGIDSSAKVSTVCLTENEKPLALFSVFSTMEHSTSLLPMIENAFSKTGLTANDLDLICVSDGPGSFTGIRIGISTAKGLAFPFGIPCIGVSTLASMAFLFSDFAGYILPVIDAKRDNVYSALFKSDGKGNIKRITEDAIHSVDSLSSLTERGPVYLTGDVTDGIIAQLKEEDLARTPALLSTQCAFGTALCGYDLFSSLSDEEKSVLAGGDILRPKYLRKTLPERLREEKSNEK